MRMSVLIKLYKVNINITFYPYYVLLFTSKPLVLFTNYITRRTKILLFLNKLFDAALASMIALS